MFSQSAGADYCTSTSRAASAAKACLLIWLLVLGACNSSSQDSIAVRLVDEFKPETVRDQPTEVDSPESPAFWDFENAEFEPGRKKPLGTLGWVEGSGVKDLRLRDGRLTGTTTSDTPFIFVEYDEPLEVNDLVHSVQVRMRVDGGANAAAEGGRSEVKAEEVTGMLKSSGTTMWGMHSPLISGEGFQTYTLSPQRPGNIKGMRHILLSPTDQTGATFEIAEVRLVTRKEHLARIPSGIGWHGLAEIYRESLVARSPESIEFALDLPPDPWLDLHLGTLDGGAMTFRVNISSGGADQTLLKRTITTAHRWEKAHIDLSEFSGQNVQVRLSLASEKDGMIGFWGSPVVRSRTAHSPQAVHPPDELVSQANTKKPQGVILIQADTLRKDHLDLYGYSRVTAPILSKMAGKGAVFMDNVSQATWTKVSTPSIMTSLYPGSHGVSEFNDLLPASATTLAEIYREAGYATVSYSSVLFTGQFTNLHQGFEELHESSSVSDTDSSKTAREFVDRLLVWLDDHRETPFFAFLHVFDPHDPYEPDSPYNTIWANPEKKDEHTKNVEKAREVIEDPLMKQFAMPNRAELLKAGLDPDEYVSNDVDWYDGSIRGLDVEIGRLLEHLENLGLDESTVIAFTSDHGEEFLDHDRMFHGQSVYGELAGVPLVLYQKGVIPSGTVVEDTVQNIDLMPTLLELSHLPVPDGLQGRSLISYLAPEQRAEAGSSVAFAALSGPGRPAFIEKAATKHAGGPPPRDTESSAVILDGWKLIHNTKRPDGVSEYELYNHSEDPLDQTDVAKENPDVVEQLSKELDKWRKTVSANQLPKASSTEGLSPEELQRLRSLGYIQ